PPGVGGRDPGVGLLVEHGALDDLDLGVLLEGGPPRLHHPRVDVHEGHFYQHGCAPVLSPLPPWGGGESITPSARPGTPAAAAASCRSRTRRPRTPRACPGGCGPRACCRSPRAARSGRR